MRIKSQISGKSNGLHHSRSCKSSQRADFVPQDIRNPLRNKPVNTAVEDMKHLWNSFLDKNPNNKLIISKVLPKVRAGRKTNNSLTIFYLKMNFVSTGTCLFLITTILRRT